MTRRGKYAVWVAGALLLHGCDLSLHLGGEPPPLIADVVEEPGIGWFDTVESLAPVEGHYVLYELGGRALYRGAVEGSPTVDLSAELQDLYPGYDTSPATTRYGNWFTLSSSRLGCEEENCLIVVRRDYSYIRRVIAGGQIVHPEGRSAINSEGDRIVFSSQALGGPHTADLYALQREGEAWSEPVLLTGKSPGEYNTMPVLSPKGDRVLFDCGPTPFSQEGTGICEVHVTGAGLTQVLAAERNPLNIPRQHALHHADYASQNTLVFESTWSGGEEIWTYDRTTDVAHSVTEEYSDDNTPCVFEDGAIASLWLGRPDTDGLHELKVMTKSGAFVGDLTPGQDIEDIGISCFGAL